MQITIFLAVLIFASTLCAQPSSNLFVPPSRAVARLAIPIDIQVEGAIGLERTSLVCNHSFSNPFTKSFKVIMRYQLPGEPKLAIYINGNKVEPKITFVSTETVISLAEYREHWIEFFIEKNTTKKVTSKMSYATVMKWAHRLWGGYNYHFDLPIHVGVMTVEEPITSSPPILVKSIKGKIKIPSNIRKVRCFKCKYDWTVNTILIERGSDFSFHFETKRVPLKAAIFYILMLSIIFSFVIVKRIAYRDYSC